MSKPVDTTKKSNIKCEHCGFYNKWPGNEKCRLTGDQKHYYNRCKSFKWVFEVREEMK